METGINTMSKVNVRIRLKTGRLVSLIIALPLDIRDYNRDTISDCVTDYLQDNKIDYKWYKIESYEQGKEANKKTD